MFKATIADVSLLFDPLAETMRKYAQRADATGVLTLYGDATLAARSCVLNNINTTTTFAVLILLDEALKALKYLKL
ncbi:MAG: hypothetical protein NT016_03405 [Candidatus Aenigmarchaeota archaeon]|nr:hypothetical protein [Candidatus Aenigmarchaeota archaeon]